MEDLVKRFVDLLVEYDELLDELCKVEEQDVITFTQAVIKEMRGRGISEERIASTVKGMVWSQKRFGAVADEIKAMPDLVNVIEKLKGGQTGSVEGHSTT